MLSMLVMLIITSGCQKERSFESPPATTGNGGGTGTGNSTGAGTLSGTSKFILVAAGGLCSDAVAYGTYVEKKPVTLADFVVMTVDVTQAGSWSYNTSTINGLKFGNSGNFTNTGKQQIILLPSGTPLSAGIVEFPLSIGSAPCTFKVTITPAAGANSGTSGEFYYKATIGGVNYSETVTDPGNFEAGSGLGGVDEVTLNASIYHTADPMPLGVTAFGVTKGVMLGYLRSTDAQFKAFFAPGTYPYTYTGTKNGISLGWRDKQGREWGSIHDTIRQPATSTFKIISVEDSYDVIGNYYIKVKMQFNCILFRDNSNEQVELKNGEFVGLFGKI
ncbi:hypothetical protein ACX0G7_17865 [Flavitalea antarctica]